MTGLPIRWRMAGPACALAAGLLAGCGSGAARSGPPAPIVSITPSVPSRPAVAPPAGPSGPTAHGGSEGVTLDQVRSDLSAVDGADQQSGSDLGAATSAQAQGDNP